MKQPLIIISFVALQLFLHIYIVEGSNPGTGTTQPPRSNRSQENVNSSLEKSKSKVAIKPVDFYYDLTTVLNDLLSGETNEKSNPIFERLRRRKSAMLQESIYYSTDVLLTELSTLTPITDLLSDKLNRNSTLHLSFRFLKNGELDPRRFQDVLQGIAQNATSDQNIHGSLSRQISAIILDWTDMGGYACHDSNEAVKYMQSMNISFTKYAQRIAGILLGTPTTSARVRIGVAYNEKQVNCDFLRPQILDADFIVFQVRFITLSFFPLSYPALSKYMDKVTEEMNYFLYGPGNLNGTMKNVTYMVTLEQGDHLKLFNTDYFGDRGQTEAVRNASEAMLERTHFQYFPILREYMWMRAEMRRKTNQIIFRSFDDYFGSMMDEDTVLNKSTFEKYYGTRERGEGLIPYLYLHETDVSSCALRTMIQEMSWYPDVVVNEYTWSAIVNHESGITAEDPLQCSTLLPRSKLHTYAPERVHLFVSSGIWAIWDSVNETLSNLLDYHPTAAGMSIKTIVFSSKDIWYTKCGGPCPMHSMYEHDIGIGTNLRGISKFIEKIQENGDISTGCLVEAGNIEHTYQTLQTLKEDTLGQCAPVFNTSTVIVWQFTLNLDHHHSGTLSFRFSYVSLKYKLFQVILARDRFVEENDGKEVIIQILPREDFYKWTNEGEYCDQVYDFYDALMKWAHIYGVRFIARPGFDVRYPMFGMRDLPDQRGKISSYRRNICRKHSMGKGDYFGPM